MTAGYVASRALLIAGVAVIVVSSCAAFSMKHVVNRLHYITPITSLGGPLVGLALAVENGWGLTTAMILFIVFLLALAGPALASATGRLTAQREGLIEREAPQ